eukprot:CAMPEP_0116015994 /NCGR_PEP_ID=MMETSP0321-20121206/7194_1 /TAXON_ID=163516 /ORGANISM="Leptocylindrus danicus var. danicus, Strain B650" /LENGTH=378 /DNA_ID=CAMNT_0003485923 /DNA_START=64 /DNA_END=1200 /DNA_ORIENTATION=-
MIFLVTIMVSTAAKVAASYEEVPQQQQQQLSKTLEFPSVHTAHEYLTLSHFIYNFDGDTNERKLPYDDLELHLFEDNPANGCVMVVSSPLRKYVAAVFRGTDSDSDWMHDLQASKVPFGPVNGGDPIIENVLVHKGFNKALFNTGGLEQEDCQFDRVLNSIQNVTSVHPDYQVITTGHSLGGALSVLMAAGLAKLLAPPLPTSDGMDADQAYNLRSSDRAHAQDGTVVTTTISAIAFAAPLTGDPKFKAYVDSVSYLGVWNHVLLNDLVPHVPFEKWNYSHPGHTIWFQREAARAYYLHSGDESLGFKGIPEEWNDSPYSIEVHKMPNYVDYMERRSLAWPGVYYVNSFEKIKTEVDNFDRRKRFDTSINMVDEIALI